MSHSSAARAAWKGVVGTLVTVLILVLLAEFGTRWYMSHRVTEEFKNATAQQGAQVSTADSDPHVTFGPVPVTWGLIRGSLDQVNVDTPSTLQINESDVNGQPPIEAHLKDVTVSDQPVAGELDASTTVPDQLILVVLQNAVREQSGFDRLGDVVITDITTHDDNDTIDAEFAGGLGSLTIHPRTENGRLAIDTQEAKVLGFELPDSARHGIEDTIREQVDASATGDLEVTHVDVRDGELKLSAHGTDVNLQQLSDGLGKYDPSRK